MFFFAATPKSTFNPNSQEDVRLFKASLGALETQRQRLKTLDSMGQIATAIAIISSPLSHIRFPLSKKICTFAMFSLWSNLAMRYERHQSYLQQAADTKKYLNWVLVNETNQRLKSQSNPEWRAGLKSVTLALGVSETLKDASYSLPKDIKEELEKEELDRYPFNFSPIEKEESQYIINAGKNYIGYMFAGFDDAAKIMCAWFHLWQQTAALEKKAPESEKREESSKGPKKR